MRPYPRPAFCTQFCTVQNRQETRADIGNLDPEPCPILHIPPVVKGRWHDATGQTQKARYENKTTNYRSQLPSPVCPVPGLGILGTHLRRPTGHLQTRTGRALRRMPAAGPAVRTNSRGGPGPEGEGNGRPSAGAGRGHPATEPGTGGRGGGPGLVAPTARAGGGDG